MAHIGVVDVAVNDITDHVADLRLTKLVRRGADRLNIRPPSTEQGQHAASVNLLAAQTGVERFCHRGIYSLVGKRSRLRWLLRHTRSPAVITDEPLGIRPLKCMASDAPIQPLGSGEILWVNGQPSQQVLVLLRCCHAQS